LTEKTDSPDELKSRFYLAEAIAVKEEQILSKYFVAEQLIDGCGISNKLYENNIYQYLTYST
jgi:hypothetical protein